MVLFSIIVNKNSSYLKVSQCYKMARPSLDNSLASIWRVNNILRQLLDTHAQKIYKQTYWWWKRFCLIECVLANTSHSIYCCICIRHRHQHQTVHSQTQGYSRLLEAFHSSKFVNLCYQTQSLSFPLLHPKAIDTFMHEEGSGISNKKSYEFSYRFCWGFFLECPFLRKKKFLIGFSPIQYSLEWRVSFWIPVTKLGRLFTHS